MDSKAEWQQPKESDKDQSVYFDRCCLAQQCQPTLPAAGAELCSGCAVSPWAGWTYICPQALSWVQTRQLL